MKLKIILLFLFLFGFACAQTKFFIPVPIESSNGRPILDADVDLYQNSVKIADLTWLNAGRYYYTDTTVVTPGAYDIFVNGISWQTSTYINYGATTSATIAAVIDDSLTFPQDTTALKLRSLVAGRVAYLKQYSSTDTLGGGWFFAIDSAFAESGSNDYFDSGIPGVQWQRSNIRDYQFAKITADTVSNSLNDGVFLDLVQQRTIMRADSFNINTGGTLYRYDNSSFSPGIVFYNNFDGGRNIYLEQLRMNDQNLRIMGGRTNIDRTLGQEPSDRYLYFSERDNATGTDR